MATPSFKTPQMEAELTRIFGVDRRSVIAQNKCTSCAGDAQEFNDDLSRKEYSISGLCQKCQDEVFGGGDE